MNAKEFIQQQLAGPGWAPINHEMAMLLCPGVVNAHRDFAVDQRNPENLTRVFPWTRLYLAHVEGVGAVPVLSRSDLILRERMAFLGFKVNSLTVFNDRTPAAQPVKPGPGTLDLIALRHADLATKEPPRSCNECGRVGSGGTCLGALLGEIEGAPMDYRPDVRQPRRCVAYAPPHGSYDDRNGRQLWPEIVEQAEKPKAKGTTEGDITEDNSTAIDRARTLLGSMLADGPVDAAAIFDVAERNGFHARTVQRAAESLGVVKTKAGFASGWVWAMPETEAA